MAEIIKRVWRSGPRKVKRVAWGYTLQRDGKRIRKFSSEWTEEDAEKALAAARLGLSAQKTTERSSMAFGEAVEKYLAEKVAEGKRSVVNDRAALARMTVAFGAETPLAEITGARIADYKAARLTTTVRRAGQTRPVTTATVNRELSMLRHLLRLAVEEWEGLDARPRIRLLKEPEGRLRWLDPDEEARLIAACRASKASAYLPDMVTVALETGLRKGELLGLTWQRIDLSRGVIRLELTKSGKRREVPMRQVVYNILAALPGPREGRVWPSENITTAWTHAVERAGLEDVRFHDMRHHFASWFVMRGGSLQALKEILGHRDIKMTLRYAHLAPDHLRQEMAKTERPAMAQDGHKVSESEPVTA